MIADAEVDRSGCAQLLVEIAASPNSDALASWAHGAMGKKNGLSAADARVIESAFEARLKEFSSSPGGEVAPRDPEPAEGVPSSDCHTATLLYPKTRRRRNKKHLAFVAKQPCVVCGRTPADAHHLSFMQPRALGKKVSDEFTVPLCRVHHRGLHDSGDEQAWWADLDIEPMSIAEQLWAETMARQTSALRAE